jgi:predicted NUDIX family NTP pyrophosphohydrolase
MLKQSAGLLLYREKRGSLEVFLVHPGGPFWARKDDGAWSIPKGEFAGDEDALDAARREFQEETGYVVAGEYLPLMSVRQAGGKNVYAWAVRGDVDAATAKSNTFSIEWPRGSGKTREFPEIDRADWFALDVARRKILKSQLPLLEQLEKLSVPGVVQPKARFR